MELDGSVIIAWEADGFAAIAVRAPDRPGSELDAFARAVADAALLNRSSAALRSALRATLPAEPGFDLRPRRPAAGAGGPRLLVTLRPPRLTPGPDDGA